MKKVINAPERVVEQMLRGMELAHGDLIRTIPEYGVVVRADAPVQGKVALVSGGGSGHEPTHGGYVGAGMLDAACAGSVFTSPTPEQMLEATKAVDGGAGVFYVVKNYTGDVLNFEMAGELAEAEGIQTDYVVTNDDVAVEDSTYTSGRRGIAGTIFVHKICGAAADDGKDLAGIKELAERVNGNTRSMGMALTSCIPPESGEPIFEIADDEMEIGMGIHGEPGTERKKIETADEIVDELLSKILGDSVDFTGSDVAVMVNGLGGTPLMELYVAYGRVADVLKNEGVNVYRMAYVGEYMTSLEMAGFSVTLLKLDDDMKTYLTAPCNVAAGRPF
jgi:phosphoenolpyruvate---glycerone phosphotransferase subunit DhaK